MAETIANEIADDVRDAVSRAMRRLRSEGARLSRDAHRALDGTSSAAVYLADDLRHEARRQSRRAAPAARRALRGHPTSLAVGAALGALTVAYFARRR